MQQKGEQWVLEADTLLEEGKPYSFVVNDKFRTHMPSAEVEFTTMRGNFNNLYQNKTIIFDPAAFAEHGTASKAEWAKGSINPDYKNMADSLLALEPVKRELLRGLKNQENEGEDKARQYLERFEDIRQKYAANFEQILVEKEIENTRLKYPVMLDASKAIHQKADSLQLLGIFHSENYQAFFKQAIKLADELDPHSYLLNGNFANFFASIDLHIKQPTFPRELYGIENDHFYHYLMNFVDTTPEEQLAAGILHSLGYYYTFDKNIERAETVLLKLKNEYPDSREVQAGYVDTQLKGLKVSAGAKAPDFAVQTTIGDSLRMSDLPGKYIFIDFWGTWCGPCIHEIPNIKALSKAFSTELLQVVGLAQDRPANLAKYVEKEALPYPNAVAEQAVKDYGITAFPTTF